MPHRARMSPPPVGGAAGASSLVSAPRAGGGSSLSGSVGRPMISMPLKRRGHPFSPLGARASQIIPLGDTRVYRARGRQSGGFRRFRPAASVSLLRRTHNHHRDGAALGAPTRSADGARTNREGGAMTRHDRRPHHAVDLSRWPLIPHVPSGSAAPFRLRLLERFCRAIVFKLRIAPRPRRPGRRSWTAPRPSWKPHQAQSTSENPRSIRPRTAGSFSGDFLTPTVPETLPGPSRAACELKSGQRTFPETGPSSRAHDASRRGTLTQFWRT
jgi:hypothetical protein